MSAILEFSNQATDKKAPAPAQIVFMPLVKENSYNDYSELQSRVNGGLQVLVGILAIVFTIVDFSYYLFLFAHPAIPLVGYGFWCGPVFIVAGSLGISTGRGRTKCKIVAFMTSSIVASAFTTIFFFIGVTSIYATTAGTCRYYDEERTDLYRIDQECVYKHRVGFGKAICMTVLAVMEAGLSIWGSTMCCKAVCCGARDQAAGVLYQTKSTVPNQATQIQILPASKA